MNSNSFFLMVPAGSLIALLFATYLSAKILRQDEGSEKMKDISLAIREGAHAYLKRQYMGVSLFFGVMFIILLSQCLGILQYYSFAFPQEDSFRLQDLLNANCHSLQLGLRLQ